MAWQIYTKKVVSDDGIAFQWFWQKPLTGKPEESPVGFTTRERCEADAALHGYSPSTCTREVALDEPAHPLCVEAPLTFREGPVT